MKNAELKIVRFDNGDVIATSGIYTFKGFYDTDVGNATINGMDLDGFKRYLVKNGMAVDNTAAVRLEAESGGQSVTLNKLYKTSGDAGNEGDKGTDYSFKGSENYSVLFNGTFTWNGTSFVKQ